jgi:translation initiation factor IF-2
MSKIKIIDMNKQLIDRSKQTVGRMESLQNSVQNHLATLKRIEAELIKIARAEAEEQRMLKQQQEAQEQAKAAAESKTAAEQPAASSEVQQAVKNEAVTEALNKPEVLPEEPRKTEAPNQVVQDAVIETKQEPAAKPHTSEQRPRQEQTQTHGGQDRPRFNQDQRGGQDRPRFNQDQHGGQDRSRFNQDQRGGQDRPRFNQDQRGGQDRPRFNQDQRGGQDRPRFNQDQRGGQDRPRFNQDQRGGQDRPRFGQDQNKRNDNQRPVATAQRGDLSKTHKPKTANAETEGFVSVERRTPQAAKKSPHNNAFVKDERGRKSKKALMKEKIGLDDGEGRYRSKRRTKNKPSMSPMPVVIEKAVMTTETISVKKLAEKTGKPVAELLKKLLLLGMMSTINSEVDYDTAQLVCSEFNIELEYKPTMTAEDVLGEVDQEDDAANLETRPPIVTVMGHVDHGKTSLLDAIRKTRVTEHEAGGITQHIGAYTITHHKRNITFLDTPGHEAFTAMRARGAQVTDIAILVVAADDGVMPQTIEAINHSKAANVPIIVAINKIDKQNANPERVKQELTEHGLIAEEWGGETIMVPVSAQTKEGIDQLLEMIGLVADMQELKANPKRLAKGTIVEAKLDKGRGPVATVLVQNGTLRVQDMIVAGVAYGRVRAMVDDMGNRVEEAYPSQPVEVVGFSEVPIAGDIMHAVEQDKLTRQVAEERKDKQKADMLKNLSKVSFEYLFSQVEQGKVQELNIVIKADVQGSVEAVRQALEKLSNSEVRVKVIHAGVGAIKAMDVMLASASNAVIIGFNVRPDTMARTEADKEKVEIRLYRVIYKAIEDLQLAIKGMLAPEYKEVVLGHAEVRTTFSVSSIGTIAGSYVTDGKITKSSQVRLLRDNIVVHEGVLASLKRFKDDVKEVNQGYECGITIKNYNDLKEGDVIEAFEMQEIKR